MTEPNKNSVTIYSNGQASIRTYVDVKPDTKLSLPFRQESIDDVLASFSVHGDVSLDSPPSFSHGPACDPGLALTASTFDTVGLLRGAKVKVKQGGQSIEGTIFSTDTQNRIVPPNAIVADRFLTIQTDAGIKSIPWTEITSIEFLEEEVRAEITKALAIARQRVKPNAVFLNATLSPTGKSKTEKAIIQWVEQLSPWSLSYRLSRKESGKFAFDIFGVCHNSTDTDWKDTILCLVTGKPMTFTSDIGSPQAVARKKIRLSDSVAKGGFTIDDGDPIMQETAGTGNLDAFASNIGAATRTMRGVLASSSSAPGSNFSNIQGSRIMNKAATVATATAEDVGDYCVYKQDRPMTIPAHTAATIPLFSAELKDAETVLVYNPSENETRPFRAISFVNETNQGLGTGVCVISERGLFQGKCIFPASKPGEKRMLVFAEETGIHVTRKIRNSRRLPRRLKVANNVVFSTNLFQSKTTYTFRNVKNEDFVLLFDHSLSLGSEATLETGAAKQIEKINSGNGVRCSINLPAKSTVEVHLQESLMSEQTIEINDPNWFYEQYIVQDKSIQADPKVKEIIKANLEVSSLEDQVTTIEQKMAKLTSQFNKLTTVLGLPNAGNNQAYQTDLKNNLSESQALDAQLDEIKTKLTKAREAVYEAVASLTGEWLYQDGDKNQIEEIEEA